MEAVLVAIGSALLGAIVGVVGTNLWTAKRDNMVRTLDIAREFSSEAVTTKRLSLRKTFTGETDVKKLMMAVDKVSTTFQQNFVELFNRYELVSGLKLRKGLDESIFDENLRQIIDDDFDYFRKVIDYVSDNSLEENEVAFPDTRTVLGLK